MWRYDGGILWKGCKVDTNAINRIEFQGEDVKEMGKKYERKTKGVVESGKGLTGNGKIKRKRRQKREDGLTEAKGGGNQSMTIHQISVLAPVHETHVLLHMPSGFSIKCVLSLKTFYVDCFHQERLYVLCVLPTSHSHKYPHVSHLFTIIPLVSRCT